MLLIKNLINKLTMKILLIFIVIFLSACSTHKPIKEHRLIVSGIKQVISPGLGWK